MANGFITLSDHDGNPVKIRVDTPDVNGAVAEVSLVTPSTATAVPFNVPGASGAVTNADGALMGVSLRETSEANRAVVRLRAGASNGTLLGVFSLTAGESVREWYGDSGIKATGGVYCELVSGSVEGSIQIR